MGNAIDRRPQAHVSVLMKTKDRPEFFRTALASVVAQTFTDVEVVVVEDGGAPYAEEIAADVAADLGADRVRVIRNQTSQLMAVATAQAVEASSAPLIALLDDDDLWDPTFLETLTGALDAAPEAVAAFCARRYIDAEGEVRDDDDPGIWDPRHPLPPRGLVRPFVAEALVEPVIHPAQSLLFRRGALDMSMWRPEITTAWDRMTTWLLARTGAAVWCEPTVLASYRVHQGSLMAARPAFALESEISLWRIMAADPALTPWHDALESALVGMLLDRALRFDLVDDLSRSRADVWEALRIRVTRRGLRTLPVVHLPLAMARGLQASARRVRALTTR